MDYFQDGAAELWLLPGGGNTKASAGCLTASGATTPAAVLTRGHQPHSKRGDLHCSCHTVGSGNLLQGERRNAASTL